MNVFVLDLDFSQCALYTVDRHVVKMPLEHAQMMCTVLHLQGHKVPYKPTHANHPCTVWLRSSLANWRWLKNLTFFLNQEYRFRYETDRNLEAWEVIDSLPVPELPNIPRTSFAQAMPLDYRGKDAVQAYRRYYAADKKHIHAWRGRNTPKWLQKQIQR